MPMVTCPYCDRQFEWTTEMGESRVVCPLCNKTMAIVRSKKEGGRAQPRAITAWETDGFRSERSRAEYGEIKKGDVLGGFRIEEMIGAGAMAVVYAATQLSLGRKVALKVLPKRYAQKESFVRQFDTETDLLASLNHPNIVSIIDRGREGDTYFFAMEYVEGTTLAEMLAAGQMDEEFFLRIMIQCAEALSYAHGKGVIHRDIKPANIMLNDRGMVKVADFGVAGLLAEAGNRENGKRRVMGTRGYMPPEQEIDVARTDARSDIFSLGAVMYRALTDTVPDHLPPPAPSRLNPDVDPRIDRLVLRCLEVNPGRRYQSADELLEALRAYHKEITRAHEVCPNCKKENPVTQKTCLHCGADLSELFDACPECGAENRIDVDVCMSCGISLSQHRQRTSVWISRAEEHARELAVRQHYAEAIDELKRVLEVKGKVFERARQKARRLIEQYSEQRKEYYRRLIDQGKQLAADGRLNESLEVLRSVPAEFAVPAEVPDLIGAVQERMAQARKRLAAVPQLLAQLRYDDARQAIESVASAWVDCPGLEEARKQLESNEETVRMVEYELAQVKEHLDKGEFSEARKALEFALTALPQHPDVRRMQEEIDRREKSALLKNAVARARKAFDEGRFQEALQLWQSAAAMLPEGAETRRRIEENAALARRKLQEASAAIEQEPEERSPFRAMTLVLGGLVAAIFVVAGVVLYLIFAHRGG